MYFLNPNAWSWIPGSWNLGRRQVHQIRGGRSVVLPVMHSLHQECCKWFHKSSNLCGVRICAPTFSHTGHRRCKEKKPLHDANTESKYEEHLYPFPLYRAASRYSRLMRCNKHPNWRAPCHTYVLLITLTLERPINKKNTSHSYQFYHFLWF